MNIKILNVLFSHIVTDFFLKVITAKKDNF